MFNQHTAHRHELNGQEDQHEHARGCNLSERPREAGKLLERIVSTSLGPLSRLRDTVDCTLDQVTDWINEPANRHQIASLVTLLDAQTQLLICQQRLVAVARLVEVASTEGVAPETIRRACADLLRVRLINPYLEDKRPVKMSPPKPIDEERILAALEELGREADR